MYMNTFIAMQKDSDGKTLKPFLLIRIKHVSNKLFMYSLSYRIGNHNKYKKGTESIKPQFMSALQEKNSASVSMIGT